MNLYAYGTMSSLLAVKEGRCHMSEEEQIGKMRHFLNVMEATASQSTAADFQSHGWVVARDYDRKVFSDMEYGRTRWSDVAMTVDSGNFSLAAAANPRPPASGGQGGAGLGAQSQKAPVKKDQLCSTYNTMKEEGCKWEAANPGKRCSYKHSCSYCSTTLGRDYPHKELTCLKKTGAVPLSTGPGQGQTLPNHGGGN
jgi:hypothetical protein